MVYKRSELIKIGNKYYLPENVQWILDERFEAIQEEDIIEG